MSEIEIRASKKPGANKIYLFAEDFSDIKNPKHAKPLELKPVVLYETDDKTSVCVISRSAAQILVNDLQKLGTTPNLL